MFNYGHTVIPLIPGHEISGVIEKVGENVPFYKKSMKVTLAPNIGCGICDECVSGNTHLCPDYKAFGININGGFAEYMVIPSSAISQGNIAVLDDKMNFNVATLAEPLSCVYNAFEKYNLSLASKHLLDFVDGLSNWYIRRSRRRFWKSENDSDKLCAYETLYYILSNYIKLLAPFMPFVTDEIYQGLNGTKESVHLDEWPVADPKAISDELEEQMAKTRQVIELGLSKRNEEGIKVRQPLNELTVSVDLPDDLLYIAAEEVNVKEVTVKEKKGMLSVELDTKITQELKNE
jgi:isoleucyl-tRNA synthetase